MSSMDFLKEEEDNSLEEFNLDNLKLAFHFAFERYEIYVKKEKRKLKPPWTKDEILQKYRFCIVVFFWPRQCVLPISFLLPETCAVSGCVQHLCTSAI